jgi:hypothetical protein
VHWESDCGQSSDVQQTVCGKVFVLHATEFGAVTRLPGAPGTMQVQYASKSPAVAESWQLVALGRTLERTRKSHVAAHAA